MAVLDVKGLKTYFSILRGSVKAVDGIDFQVEKGKALGLAGESGCGKTTTALSILRILPSNGRIVGGEILFGGLDITRLDEGEMRQKIRWQGISLVFQGSMSALNPVYKIGDQICEAIQLHEPDVSKQEAEERAGKLFEMVGIEPSRIDNYPHEFSGGMKQRACIAMALSCNPELVITDEPTTALDVIVQAQVLKLMRELKRELDLSMILITHDLSVICDTCDTCAIMYAGKIVEEGDIAAIFKEAIHPYTKGLVDAFPDINAPKQRMISIRGYPPDLLQPPSGCRFHPRCTLRMDICKKQEPESIEVSRKHVVACHLVGKT